VTHGTYKLTDDVALDCPQQDSELPAVLTPRGRLDLAGWLLADPERTDQLLDRHGALVLRGFGLRDAADFEQAAAAISPDLFTDYGDLPAEPSSNRVYGSTPYPADKTILFHNESAHLPSWPLRQFFFCVTPAPEGGATALLDGRLVCQRLDRDILDDFQAKGLLYIRNFTQGLDVAWQDFFRTRDRAAVERACAADGLGLRWLPDDGLRTWQRAPGVIVHPRTGQLSFFNQVQLHHISRLDPETADALRALYGEDELPRDVRFGDGSPIPGEYLNRISDLYEELAVDVSWQAGDLVVVDNMLVAHARRPFSGQRKILVAMGGMVRAPEPAGLPTI
jgi:alpha-ketoglutarate-dependent taurine dioxygenase